MEALILPLIIAIYFLPTIISYARGLNCRGSIFIVNLFLGWTFIAWVLCLAWSAKGKD